MEEGEGNVRTRSHDGDGRRLIATRLDHIPFALRAGPVPPLQDLPGPQKPIVMLTHYRRPSYRTRDSSLQLPRGLAEHPVLRDGRRRRSEADADRGALACISGKGKRSG